VNNIELWKDFFDLWNGWFSFVIFSIFVGVSVYNFICIYFVSSNVFVRLGKNIIRKEIIIVADSTNYDSLKTMFIDSGIFKDKNIKQGHIDSIDKYAESNFLILHYNFCKEHIDTILNKKKDSATLIVYAPSKDGQILPNEYNLINEKRNTIIVNLRGRLLNDLLVSFMTNNLRE
jgi:hypothetical protein